MDEFQQIAQVVGVDPSLLALIIPVAVLSLNILGRAIPDDKTGILGIVRAIAKIGGLYLSNRVSSGISVNKVAQVAAGLKPIQDVPALFESLASAPAPALDLPEEVVEPKPMFPGVRRGPDGKFLPKDAQVESPLWVGLIALGLMLYLGGCAATQAYVPTTPCGKAAVLRAAAERTIKMIDTYCPIAHPDSPVAP